MSANAEREVVLDTETTGLNAGSDRIIEVGCVEIIDRRVTGRSFHRFVNPERAIDAAAVAVHGITLAQLRDKPLFAAISDDLLAFIGDAALVIHNAEFDMGFLAMEFDRCDRAADWPPAGPVIDTLPLARSKHPHQRNSLDALCKRYEVDSSQRELHGALLDAQLLADVYLRLTGGQNSLELGTSSSEKAAIRSVEQVLADTGKTPRVLSLSDGEREAHEAYLDRMQAASERCLWRELAAAEPR